MSYRSQLPAIKFPNDQTLWSWLFESCLRQYDENELQGYTDVTTNQHISYNDLKSHTEVISSLFYERYGLRPGDVVVVYSKNSIWYPVIALAAVRIGALACGVSPEYTTEELSYTLRLTRPKLLFAGKDTVEKARAAGKACDLPARKILRLEDERDDLESIEALLQEAIQSKVGNLVPPFRIPRGMNNHQVCAYLCLSSGTTGLPKAVMISHANIIAQCLQVQQITPKDHDKVVGALPFYHITGIIHEVHLPIVLNAHTYVLPTFTLDSLLAMVSKYKIKEVLVVPPILIRMVRDPKTVSKYDLRHVRRFSSGAAPLPREVLTLLEKQFPGTGFKQGYGMTESCSAITSHPPAKYAYKYGDKVGMVVGSTELKIIDANTGRACRTGESGEIWARGPQVAMGYLNNPKASAETFDAEGFLHTGDIGYVDDEGLLSITDRMKEMIKVKGIGVAPAELENLLLGHPLISDAAVCGITDDRAGERPKAFVVLQPTNVPAVETGKDIINYTKAKKARHKWIVEVEVVEKIPKSPAGKILRKKLRERTARGNSNVIVRDDGNAAKL